MEANILDKVCEQVYRKFPDMAGSKPKVQAQPDTSNYLITFKGSATTADGKKIQRVVRVVATDKGKILKFSTSR